jgi:hypothetical protein
MNFDLAEQLNEFLLDNDLDKAINLTENKLSELPKTDFHKILGKDLKHLTASLANYIDDFYKTSKEKIDVKAIYSEMNGFTINYDLWFIDLFAFTKCGGVDDLDWLSDFEVSSYDSLTITGFEDLQTVYEDYMENEKWKDNDLVETCEVCELLIILRLQELFREAKKLAVDKKLESADIPIFVTAHDYDLIYQARV